jgi:hypothetical protein
MIRANANPRTAGATYKGDSRNFRSGDNPTALHTATSAVWRELTGMNTKTFFSLLAATSFCVVAPVHAAQETASEKTSDAWDATKRTTKKVANTVANTTKQAANKVENAVKPSGPVQQIDVNLGNTGANLSKTTVAAGRVKFQVMDNTELSHKISITGGSLKGADIDVSPNRSGAAEVDLAPGTYIVGCTLKDHKEAKARLTVK